MNFLPSNWWVRGLGMPWEQWARLDSGGKVTHFDTNGGRSLKANYRNRLRASQTLRRRGFRNLSRGELKSVPPPADFADKHLHGTTAQVS